MSGLGENGYALLELSAMKPINYLPPFHLSVAKQLLERLAQTRRAAVAPNIVWSPPPRANAALRTLARSRATNVAVSRQPSRFTRRLSGPALKGA